MRFARAAAFLLLLSAAPAAAQDEEPAAELAPEKDPAVIEVRDKLKNDPAMLEVVAERVARSRLIERLTTETDKDARLAAAKEWIKGDTAAAAHVARPDPRDARAVPAPDLDGALAERALRAGALGGARQERHALVHRSEDEGAP